VDEWAFERAQNRRNQTRRNQTPGITQNLTQTTPEKPPRSRSRTSSIPEVQT
jgi:hypothetical protein